jgi:hypothetical protein
MDNNLRDSKSNWEGFVQLILLVIFFFFMIHICSRLDQIYEIETQQNEIQK